MADRWYFQRAGVPIGPFERAELAALVASGRIAAADQVGMEGGEWTSAALAGLVPPPGAVTHAGGRGGSRGGWVAAGIASAAVGLLSVVVALFGSRPPDADAPPPSAPPPAGPGPAKHAGAGYRPDAPGIARAAGSGAPPTAADWLGPAVAPRRGGSERLYLLYKLERLYQQLPQTMGDPDGFVTAVAAVRREGLTHLADLRGRKAEAEVADLYADLVAAADDDVGLAADLGRVGREAAARVTAERAESGYAAGFKGGEYAAAAYGNGASGGRALVGAAAVGLFTYLIDDLGRGSARDEARRAAQERVLADHRRRFEGRAGRLEAAVRGMAEREGWPRGSVPFLDPVDPAEQIAQGWAAGDAVAVLRLLDAAAARRPDDPFLPLCAAVCPFDSPVGAAYRAAACAAAEGRVPEGRVYDADRVLFWAAAGWLELAAAVGGEAAAMGRAKADVAAALALDPVDAGGDLRAQKAIVMWASGDARGAYRLASDVTALRGRDPLFAVMYVRLSAGFGTTKGAFEWLAYLVGPLEHADVAGLRADPALAPLARADPAEWDRLTLPKFKWDIRRGLLFDTVVLRNDSPFPLTNLKLSAEASAGDRRWAQTLTAARVAPGGTVSWEKVKGIPPHLDRASASLACDQQGR